MSGLSAKLRFLSATEGGRQVKPHGPSYSTAAKFDGVQDSWSLVFLFREVLPDGTIIADASFLSPEAPEKLQKTGLSFELFEGRRRVAFGELITQEDANRIEDHAKLAAMVAEWANSTDIHESDFDLNSFSRIGFTQLEAAA